LRRLGQSHALTRMPAILVSRGHRAASPPWCLAAQFLSTELVPPASSDGFGPTRALSRQKARDYLRFNVAGVRKLALRKN
jgi:hypothetical protein